MIAFPLININYYLYDYYYKNYNFLAIGDLSKCYHTHYNEAESCLKYEFIKDKYFYKN